jgi:hypothetical protein
MHAATLDKVFASAPMFFANPCIVYPASAGLRACAIRTPPDGFIAKPAFQFDHNACFAAPSWQSPRSRRNGGDGRRGATRSHAQRA